jgi:hypothetical protein
MRPRASIRFVLVAAALAGSGWIARASDAPLRPDVRAIVTRVGERVAAYYHRAQQLICLERSTVIPIDSSWTIQGFARTVESELRVELDALDGDAVPDPQVTRQVLRVNGREPRPRDRKDRDGCTDPTPVSPEPLAFLLPAHRDEYQFTAVRDGREGDRAALVIEFASAERVSRAELIESASGHDDCFGVKGDIAIKGRVWVDAATADVLRLEEHIAGPTDIRVSWPMQQKHQFSQWLTLDRYDFGLRYKPVLFSEPSETVLLPASSELVEVFRTGLRSTRRLEVFSDYRRFLTDTRIIKGR